MKLYTFSVVYGRKQCATLSGALKCINLYCFSNNLLAEALIKKSVSRPIHSQF